MSRSGSTINIDENKEIAKVDWRVYMKYIWFRKSSFLIFLLVILGYVSKRFSELMFDIVLLSWVKSVADLKSNDEVLFILLIGVTFLTAIIAFVSGLIVAWFGLSIAKNLFRKMIETVWNAQINLYFDITPSGIILNRFSKDIHAVDIRIPMLMKNQLNNYLIVISALWITAYNVIWALAVVPFLVAILVYLLNSFSAALKEAARMESVTNSPTITHLGETINGVSTIRAYERTADFENKQCELLDKKVAAMLIRRGVQSWFNIRINMLSVIIMIFTYTYWIFSKNSSNSVMIGIMMIYLMELQGSLMGLFRQMAIMDSQMICFERCMNILKVPQEAKQRSLVPTDKHGHQWIYHGEIVFKNFSLRYRPDTEIILKNISFTIKSKEKIGVVGRTGAGKSTLCLALCRIVERLSGSIEIDGQDIHQIGLTDLRERITIIPQESTLFEDTLRFNLDPEHKCTDEEIMELINKASLADLVVSWEHGLERPISMKGENLSSGEKQLICICRAILRKNKIVIMDEATASIDVKTEQTVQKLIHEEFKDSTVITVAHRLNTIMHSDKILVMSFGEVIEFDAPQKLMDNPKSEFYSLLKEFHN